VEIPNAEDCLTASRAVASGDGSDYSGLRAAYEAYTVSIPPNCTIIIRCLESPIKAVVGDV
jgi:hypothetical protein